MKIALSNSPSVQAHHRDPGCVPEFAVRWSGFEVPLQDDG